MIRRNLTAIIFGVAILLVMSVAAYLQSEANPGDGHPSSYSTRSHGGKAAYLLLQKSGYPVERWEHSPKDLPVDGGGTLIIVAAPQSRPTTDEANAFSHFLSHGGSILAAGMLPDAFVPKAAAASADDAPRIGGVECKPVAPTRLTRGGSISLDGDLKWDSTDSSQMVHFEDPKGNAVVISYLLGSGSVVWWASAWPLENAGIREKNNLELLLNSTAGYQRILWDEYYQDTHTGKAMPKSGHADSWALAQLALVGLAVILTYSRRSGPLVPVVQPSRASPLEFVETLAGVFRRARSTQVAVEIAFQRLRQVAARRLGIRGSSNASEIVDAMLKLGIHVSEPAASLLRQSESAISDDTLTERRAIALVRALNEATQAMEPRSKTSKSKGSDGSQT
jgi:hypothetical protein